MSDTSSQPQDGFSPPYNVPWATFQNTIEKVVSEMPNRVDREYLSNQSGSIQSYVISAFKAFGLINDDLTVTAALRSMVDEDGRKSELRRLMEVHYPKAVELGKQNSTDGELNESFAAMFPTVTGESRVKAIRFFLVGCEYLEIPRSPLWKKQRSSPGPTQRKQRRRNGGTGGPSVAAAPPSGAAALTEATMKTKYFELLLAKANDSTELSSDILDRIERLLDLDDGAAT